MTHAPHHRIPSFDSWSFASWSFAATLASLGCIGWAGCADSSTAKPQAKPGAPSVAAAAGPAPAQPAASAPAQLPTPSAPTPPAAPPPENDSCRLTVSGAVTGSGVGRGGSMAVMATHWETESERQAKDIYPGQDLILINCNVPELTTTIEIASPKGDPAAARAAVPMAGKRYEFAPPKYGEKRVVTVMATLHGKSLGASSGAIELTEFDSGHLAGTFRIDGSLIGDASKVTIDGSFSFLCPGQSGCPRR